MTRKKNRGQNQQSRGPPEVGESTSREPGAPPVQRATVPQERLIRGAEGGVSPVSQEKQKESKQDSFREEKPYSQLFPQEQQRQTPQQTQRQPPQQTQRQPSQQTQWQPPQQTQRQPSQQFQQQPSHQTQWQPPQQTQRQPSQQTQRQPSQQFQQQPSQQTQWQPSQQVQRQPSQQVQHQPSQQVQRQPSQQVQRQPSQQVQRQPSQQVQRQPSQQVQRQPSQQTDWGKKDSQKTQYEYKDQRDFQSQRNYQDSRFQSTQSYERTIRGAEVDYSKAPSKSFHDSQQSQDQISMQQGRPQQKFDSVKGDQFRGKPQDSSEILPQHLPGDGKKMPSSEKPESHYENQIKSQVPFVSKKQDFSATTSKQQPIQHQTTPSIIDNMKSLAISTPKDETTAMPSSTSAGVSTPSEVKSSPKKSFNPLKLNIKIAPTTQMKFLPQRPDDGGKKGRPIQLIINCCDVKINPMKIFMYDIELTKAEVTSRDQKKREVTLKMKKKDTLRAIIKELLQGKEGLPVFDGGRIIFNNKLLPYDEGGTKITHTYTMDNEPVTCHFTIQRVKEEDIELDNLNNYVNSKKGRSDDMPQEALRALDTIMREMFLNKNLLNIGGRAIFDPKTTIPLRCGPYVLMEGYATTIRPHMWKVRFNFDKTQVVCHEPINLYSYISKIINIDRGFNVNVLTKKLKTLRVQSDHLKNAEGKSYSRKYTICGFSKKSAKEEKIDEKNITIEQYYLQEHKIQLKYPNLPMIKTNPTKPTYIPVELLKMLPHQKVVDTDGKIVQEVIKFAAIPCFDRLDKLRNAIKSLQLDNRADRFMKNYMIEINPLLINLTARVLDGPEALFGDQKKEALRSGKWDIRSKRFLKPYDKLVNWALFGVGTERDYQRNEQPLFDVESGFATAAKKVGINMAPSFHFEYVTYQRIEVVALETIKNSEKQNKKLDLLVFVVITDDDYRAVKRFGDMVFGIVTQCMKYSNLSRQKFLDQYLSNIMLKVNGKLGGINWELCPIRNNIFTPIKDSFMVFGIDVTHPASTKNDLSKSIAAMVGSLDNNATLYSAIIRQQISKKEKSIVEVVLEMEDMVNHLLLNFYKANKGLKPRHLIFYRDGVSEGQFEIVFKHEIIAIQNACQKLDKDYQPPITYIVVQKRHKIRFFPQKENDGVGKSGNVPSGTIVDKDITHCREFDFYLCSHDGIQGTSKPAHYHVLFDENNWGSDDLQSFTYFLCHVYARCTRSVSYPAPTYYAHLAAFRGRTLIGQTDDDCSSVASGHSSRTDSSDSQILINKFHNDKLFFI